MSPLLCIFDRTCHVTTEDTTILLLQASWIMCGILAHAFSIGLADRMSDSLLFYSNNNHDRVYVLVLYVTGIGTAALGPIGLFLHALVRVWTYIERRDPPLLFSWRAIIIHKATVQQLSSWLARRHP